MKRKSTPMAQLVVDNLVRKVQRGESLSRNNIEDSKNLGRVTINDILKYQENACLADTGRNINKLIMINGIAHDLNKLGRYPKGN